jgi:phosphatidylserine/phosphatidylglycerophosphate/cardiolipin synthase-like enzyme
MSAPAVEDWLLPASVRPRRPGNLVTPLVHGHSYFARLVEVVSGTGAGDLVWFTDWRGDADQLLTESGPTVAKLFAAAAERRVDVRALLWRSHSDRTSFSAQENQGLGRAINEAGGCALLDERVRRGGSHHQKLVVVRFAGRPHDDVAFVGGIDLCHSRRDDADHGGDRQRQPMDARYGPAPPWHDAMVEIRGPAVRDVQETFVERWTDPTPLDHRNPYRRWRQRAADMPAKPTPLPAAEPAPPSCGPHVVQLLRTYGAKRPPYPFAVHGERTIAAAYERAFAKAERLIYLEDQYLWSSLVARALARALERQPRLQVVALVPRYPDADGRLTGPPNRWGQVEALEVLHRAGGQRVAVFDAHNPQGTPVYVHAKICIVDDTWMTCGSDNFNRRSWTHDSETSAAIVDPGGELARHVRLTLWAEHLQLPPGDGRLNDLDGAIELWRQRADASDSRVAVHRPMPVGRLTAPWAKLLYRTIYDPDGRPIQRRLRHGPHGESGCC